MWLQGGCQDCSPSTSYTASCAANDLFDSGPGSHELYCSLWLVWNMTCTQLRLSAHVQQLTLDHLPGP